MMGNEVQAECRLLDPVCLKLSISRNLAAGWYHGHPDVEISGKLDTLAVSGYQASHCSIIIKTLHCHHIGYNAISYIIYHKYTSMYGIAIWLHIDYYK